MVVENISSICSGTNLESLLLHKNSKVVVMHLEGPFLWQELGFLHNDHFLNPHCQIQS